jgi:signal transduction histidine kinase
MGAAILDDVLGVVVLTVVSRAVRLMPLLRRAARRHEATVTAAVPDDLAPILADPDQLQQLLINLVVNALGRRRPAAARS